MGYTHYWTSNGSHDPLPPSALDTIKEVLQPAYQAGIIQREFDDSRPPLITATEIRFNGVGEQGHETFCFDSRDDSLHGFCKTAQKPYDELVMKVLLILAYYRPGLTLNSDGFFAQEWLEAIEWFNEVVDRAYVEQRIHFPRSASGYAQDSSCA
jgi:hypothetical protein